MAGKHFSIIFGGKSNYRDMVTNEGYWIPGCKKQGGDRLYGARTPVEIDEEAREEYWTQVRGKPEKKTERFAETGAKYSL